MVITCLTNLRNVFSKIKLKSKGTHKSSKVNAVTLSLSIFKMMSFCTFMRPVYIQVYSVYIHYIYTLYIHAYLYIQILYNFHVLKTQLIEFVPFLVFICTPII